MASNDGFTTTINNTNKGDFILSKMTNLSLNGPINLILASQSPRRREILDMMGLQGRYFVKVSPLDEASLQRELAKDNDGNISPESYAKTLAEAKARALAEQSNLVSDILSSASNEETTTETNASESQQKRITFVLGSDTIVDLDGSILEKPESEAQAIEMLRKLSGAWHQVHTGVSLYCVEQQQSGNNARLITSFTDTTRVKFTTLDETVIQAYVDTGEPFDKAGSYGIQGIGGQFVERIEGDFFTVMGLPMYSVSRELGKAISSV